jgi:hypothetical protein
MLYKQVAERARIVINRHRKRPRKPPKRKKCFV